jgi:predicted enzyme related to lactoylglutathione lyase
MTDIEYSTFSLGGPQPIAGMMTMTPEMKAMMKPEWGVYFTVTDPDATVKLVESLGGSAFLPPNDIEGVGRFAGVVSPHGVRFYVIRYAM